MNAKFQIVLSMTVFGTLALFVKKISLPAEEIALFRALTASICLMLYKALTVEKIQFAPIKKELAILFLSGAAMAFNWIFLFKAYHHTSVSIATLSYYFAPMVVMIASPILFKEKLTHKQIICFIMATIGLVMIIGVSGTNQSHENFTGIAFGLAAAVLYAIVILLNKSIKSVTGLDRTLIQFFAAIIILLPYTCLTTGIHITRLDQSGLFSLLFLGIVHTSITYCLYFSSLKNLKGQEAAIFSYIDPLVAIILSVLVLNESITPVQILGGGMILGFTLFNELRIGSKIT